jgi:hypothetical protein
MLQTKKNSLIPQKLRMMTRRSAEETPVKDKTIKCIALLILLYPALSFSQQRDDFLRPFFGYYDSQSLTTSIGNATVASGQIVPGRSSNPANLGLNRFGHLQVSFQNNNFRGPAADNSSTKIGGLYAVIPVRVYRGSLVFGGGVQRIVDFSNAFHSSKRQALEEGGMYATEFGVSVEAAENLFVGGAFNFLKGSDELSYSESDTNSFLNPKYSGYNFSFGFINRTTPNLQIGASVQTPTIVQVKDNLITYPVASPEKSNAQTWNYELKRPLVFHLGFSLLYPVCSFFYEMEWTDWQDMEFSSDEYFDGDVAEINLEINRELRSTLTHHLGAAAHLPWLPLHIYAGYQFMPVPFTGVYENNRRQSLSLGSSYLLNQQLSIHSSYSYYFWKYKGDAEKYSMLAFGASFHF